MWRNKDESGGRRQRKEESERERDVDLLRPDKDYSVSAAFL